MTNEEQIIKFKKSIEFYENNKESNTTSNYENIVKLKKAIEVLEKETDSKNMIKKQLPEEKFNYAPMIIFWSVVAILLFLFISSCINNYNEMTTERENTLRNEKIRNETRSLTPAEADSMIKNDYPKLYKELENK